MVLAPREVISVVVPVPFDTVWAHVREPRLIRAWYGWNSPDLDDEIRQVFVREAQVQRASGALPVGWLRWHNRDQMEVRGSWGNKPRTTIVVRRPDHALLATYDGVRDESDEQWITWIYQLSHVLTHHLGEERHTFAVFGLNAERPDRTLYRAGLHGARGVPRGGAVEIRRPDGALLGGRLEYRTTHQFGVVLVGGSLLVVQVVPPLSRPPHGAVNAFWSTYGLDDRAREVAGHRWAAWWPAPAVARRA